MMLTAVTISSRDVAKMIRRRSSIERLKVGEAGEILSQHSHFLRNP
jgi:hypothetical protein